MVEPKLFVNKKLKKNSILQNNSHEIKGPCVKRKSLDLDDLFEFSAARDRALERNACRPSTVPPSAEYVPHRVFINHIDSFNGKHLASYIADQAVGQSKAEFLEAEEQPEEEKENISDEDEEGKRRESFAQYSNTIYYEIVGTLEFANNMGYQRTEDIYDIIDQENKSELLSKVMTCGFVIYDISPTSYCHPYQIEEAAMVLESIVKKLEQMEKNTPKGFEKYKDCRTFILISTLMTWAKTKPIDPEDPELAFTEADYRKRKPHPNYKIHCELEKKVIEMGKRYPKNLRTIVVGSGITYGHEEDVLHFLFKMAWRNAPHLPLFGPGKNLLPMIHVDSLASVIHLMMEEFPKRYKYIIACDQVTTKLREIVKLVSKKLGNGKVLKVSKEEAFLYPEIKQRNYDMLTVNINILPGYIVEKMDVKWNSELPFVENVGKLIYEFKKARGLEPIKIFIHGPPASGKSFLAKRLASHYQIHYLNVKDVIESNIQNIKDRIEEIVNKGKKAEEKSQERKIEIEGDDADDEEDEDEEPEDDIETLKETLNEIEINMMNNERNRLDDEYVIKFFKTLLSGNACQNQGFIIDGYPKTLELTKTLYEPEEGGEEALDEEEEEGEGGQGGVEKLCNTKIMPRFVESLDASDEFLIRRVIGIPEIYVQNTHYVEEDMCRRLNEFRNLNTEDNTPLIFYDELDVHPMIYNVELDDDPDMEPTFQAIIKHIGPPKNYGLQGEDLVRQLDLEDKKRKQQRYEELQAKEAEARMGAQHRREKNEHWMLLKNEEKEMEEKALAIMAMPLRHYLMKYIFPTLTRGLVEVAKVRPDDPVDYLAEYLFKENPEGKMFQPDYYERAEELAKAMEDIKSWKGGSKVMESKDIEESVDETAESGVVSNVSEVNAKCLGTTGRKSSSRKSEFGEKTISRKSSSFGSCTCCSSSRSSSVSAPGTVCTCPTYPPGSSSSRSSKSSERSGESSRPKNCKCK